MRKQAILALLSTGILIASCGPDGGDCSPCVGASSYFELTQSDGSMTKIALGGEDSIGLWSTVTCDDTQLKEMGYSCSCPVTGVCQIYAPMFESDVGPMVDEYPRLLHLCGFGN